MSKIKNIKKLATKRVYDLKPGIRGYDRYLKGIKVGCTIICKDDFDKYIWSQGLSRKKAAKIYGISYHLYQNSIHYWYGGDEIKLSGYDKVKESNRLLRKEIWNDSLKFLENLYPGISDIFLNNLQNPRVITEKLEELNSDFYEIKAFIKLTKKYIRQACKRHGVEYIKFPSNLQEYRVKRALKELGYTPISQFYIRPYWYDYKIGKVLIEYDGKQTHNNDGTLNSRDKAKEELSNKMGYVVVRIPYKYDGIKLDENLVLLKKVIKEKLKPYEKLLKDN
jgi:very-short-patch-repair endonuclease